MAKEGDILSTTEQTHQQDLERLMLFGKLNDAFSVTLNVAILC